MLKKILAAIALFLLPVVAFASILGTQQGGTGSSSPSGILFGNNNATPLSTLTVGTGLTLTGSTLAATGGSSASSTLLGDTNTFSGFDTFSNTITGSITGNAGTATKLFTTRAINGVNFDGSAAITINAASSTLLGDFNTFTHILTASITGNAGTATALAANGTNCSAGSYALGVDASGNAEGCTVASTGTVTGVTGTWPIISSGGATPAISYAGFGTTTNAGIGNNLMLYTNNSGVVIGAATSSLSIGGNAATATKFATARTIAITGDLAYTSPSFDGSGNVTAAGTLATVNSNVGSFTNANITVNAKGLITAASNGSAGSGSFPFTPINATSVSTSSGLVITASSTIGNGTAQGGLTVSGNATTTGNLTVGPFNTVNNTNPAQLLMGNFENSGTPFPAWLVNTSGPDYMGIGQANTSAIDSLRIGPVNTIGIAWPSLASFNTYIVLDGKVGINTLVPQAQLDVQGEASSSNVLDAALTSGNCLQASTGGLLTTISSACGTVTSVTASYPLASSGGATPNITTNFGTTTAWGMGNNGLVMTGATGIPFSQATSSAIALNISGNAATVTTNANLTGVITSSGNTTSFGSQSAGVLGSAVTGNTGVLATSTLFGAVQPGKILAGANGVLQYVATTTDSCSSGITCSFAGTAESFSIGNNALTLAMLPTQANGTVLANGSGATAVPSAISTTTLYGALGAPGTVLMSSNGAAIWAATSTGAGTVTSVSETVPAFLSISGSPITTSGTLAISYSGTALPIANGGTGETSASLAFNALSPLSTKGDLVTENAVGSAVRLAAGTDGLALIANSGATNGLNYAQLSLTAGVSGILPIANGGTGSATVSANTIFGNSTGATAAPSFFATSTLFTYSAGLTQASGVQKQIENRSFSYATSTAWTGTTTIPLGIGYGEVWNFVRCFTDAGTLNVNFYHASSHMDFFNASTTKGKISFTTNNTDTDGDSVNVDIGTPASTPSKISCTVNDTI